MPTDTFSFEKVPERANFDYFAKACLGLGAHILKPLRIRVRIRKSDFLFLQALF